MWYFSGERLNSSLSLYLKVVIEISSLRMDWGSLFQRERYIYIYIYIYYFRIFIVRTDRKYVCLHITCPILRNNLDDSIRRYHISIHLKEL